MQNPEVGRRSCKECQEFQFDDGPRVGQMAPAATERPARSGKKVKRVPGEAGKPRCDLCPKIPLGCKPVPSEAVELSPKNRKAYLHFLECRAIGSFGAAADDPIVRRNAVIIRRVRDEADHLADHSSNVQALSSVFRKSLKGG